MTLSELVAGVVLKATGEVSTATEGDAEWNKILGIANYYIIAWANEPGVDWDSLYTPEQSFGAVTNTSTFALPATVTKISDKAGDTVRIDWTDGVGYTTFQVVTAADLKRYYLGNKSTAVGDVCAQVGRNLVFNRTFVSTDAEFGGIIKVPIYTTPTALAVAADTVPVDNPNWLVTVCAAEYVRNDITLAGQYPNLVAEANQIMTEMKDNNDTAQYQEMYRVPVGDGVTW